MLVPNRHHSYEVEDYRYSFQGQEKDDELKGKGKSINYTFRMHDTRVGRFFAVDPLAKKYPHYTPYSFSGNKVIAHVELEGLEEAWSIDGGSVKKVEGPTEEVLNSYKTKEEADLALELQRNNDLWKSIFSRAEAAKNQDAFSGKDLVNIGVMVYGAGEGTATTIKDFDKILEAMKSDVFLSDKFNKKGELRQYKLDANGNPLWKGRTDLGYSPEDIAKEAKKFRLKGDFIKVVKATGVTLNVVGAVLVVNQGYEEIVKDGELSLGTKIDGFAASMAFVPGGGWAVSLSIGVMRITVPLEFNHEVSPSYQRFGE